MVGLVLWHTRGARTVAGQWYLQQSPPGAHHPGAALYSTAGLGGSAAKALLTPATLCAALKCGGGADVSQPILVGDALGRETLTSPLQSSGNGVMLCHSCSEELLDPFSASFPEAGMDVKTDTHFSTSSSGSGFGAGRLSDYVLLGRAVFSTILERMPFAKLKNDVLQFPPAHRLFEVFRPIPSDDSGGGTFGGTGGLRANEAHLLQCKPSLGSTEVGDLATVYKMGVIMYQPEVRNITGFRRARFANVGPVKQGDLSVQFVNSRMGSRSSPFFPTGPGAGSNLEIVMDDIYNFDWVEPQPNQILVLIRAFPHQKVDEPFNLQSSIHVRCHPQSSRSCVSTHFVGWVGSYCEKIPPERLAALFVQGERQRKAEQESLLRDDAQAAEEIRRKYEMFERQVMQAREELQRGKAELARISLSNEAAQQNLIEIQRNRAAADAALASAYAEQIRHHLRHNIAPHSNSPEAVHNSEEAHSRLESGSSRRGKRPIDRVSLDDDEGVDDGGVDAPIARGTPMEGLEEMVAARPVREPAKVYNEGAHIPLAMFKG